MRLIAAILLCLLAAAGVAKAADATLNVYNWTDYIDPYAITRFERETGIHVNYDVYDSLETLEAKLLAGHSGYDVVVPTSEPTLSRLIAAGALQPLDRAQLPNLENLDQALMRRVASSDPGNRYAAIYLWGTIGLGLNPARIHALAPDAPLESWDLMFKPELAKRIAPCGISMLDSAIDVIPTVLHILGRSPDSTDPADLAAVAKALHAIRPYIRNFASSGELEALAAGDTCLAFAYSGDVVQAQARAREAGKGVTLQYVAPAQGAQLWFDTLAIPKNAPHPQAALAFINFLEQPDVMAGITNQVRYANAIPASRPMIQPDVAGDPNIYPPPQAMAHFFTIGPVSAEATRARNRMWARFKSGD